MSLLVGVIWTGSWVFAQAPAGKNAGNATGQLTPDSVVLAIGDVKITVRDVEDYLAALPPQPREYYSKQGRAQLPDLLITNKLLTQEAVKRGLDKQKSVQKSLQIARESILTSAVQEQVIAESRMTDEQAAQFLEANKLVFEEAHVKRIMLSHSTALPIMSGKKYPPKEEVQKKADELHKKLVDGGDFEELAAKFSDDMMTSGKGGDLGFVRRPRQQKFQEIKQTDIPISPPVESVIFSIPIGSISDVIDGPFGFEIVKVEERRLPKVADVKQEMETKVQMEKLEALMKDLRGKSQIRVEQGYFNRK
jgi:parvulin-like peptidyl-prolyl isomerase